MRTRAVVTVGRATQMFAVDRALAAARAGRGGSLFLTGEGGIGKSRLAAAAADRAYDADMCLMRGRGSTIGPIVPFRPLTEALMSLLRGTPSFDVGELGPYGPALGRLVPDLAPTGTAPDSASLVVLAEAVLRLTGLVGRERGCLLVLDDLQDADAETLAVVEYLIDNLDRQPTLLLGTVRTEESTAIELVRSAARRDACTVLPLDRLTADELRELAASCLGVEATQVPEAVIERLWADSAGNPFLAEELLNEMVDSGLLAHTADGWRVAGELRTNVPATLASSVARRVERLDPQARDLLAVAAVLGRRFPVAVVQEVTGLDDRSLLSQIGRAHV